MIVTNIFLTCKTQYKYKRALGDFSHAYHCPLAHIMENLPFGKLISVLLSLLLFVNVADISLLAKAEVESKVYIVYLGRKQHDDLKLITSSHHEMLSAVLGSKEASADSMVYSYKHGFSGFAAKLTPSQAQKVAVLPGVLHVIPNHFYKLQTTRSWDYLGLSFNSPTNQLLHDSKMGEDVIIGVIDTGVWPESEAFNDEGLGPIPSKWKGFCQAGTDFDPKKNCNRKVIGARYFIDGLLAELGIKKLNTSEFPDHLSARDDIGHGTHTASTAGGSFVNNVSHNGLGFGTIRGGAPRSRLAIYKVIWTGRGGSSADILKAFDEAIHDGVDVLSLSLGVRVPLYSELDARDLIYFGSFHAVAKGITVVCAGGNSGPTSQTVTNVAPWVITVAASTIDRSFPTIITLGNNQTLMGQALYSGKDTDVVTLAYPETRLIPRHCESLTKNDTWMAGKVVLCFTISTSLQEIVKARKIVLKSGASGLIIAQDPIKALDLLKDDSFPSVQVNFQTGTEILNYIRSTRSPKAQLRSSKTYIGKAVSTYVASFSSRGPNTLAPAVLKPDVAAPGVNILAAVPPEEGTNIGYDFMSGTSMATPHVAGITALLKSLHPNWSPAAIKSALVTTAWTTDPHSGEPIFAEGMRTKVADPFDFGGGIVNPNRARDPGLVYDMGMTDYIHYLCTRGYDNSAISQLTEQAISCPKTTISLLDLNFPSITIPSLSNSTIVTRTVTNVGVVYSTYNAIVEAPQGYTIKVRPNYLKFTSKIKSISFTVTVSTSHQATTEFYFGSLTWTSGVHKVRIPISVKTEIPEYVG